MNTLRNLLVALSLAAAAAAQGAPTFYQLPIRGIMPAFPAGVIMPTSTNPEIEKKAAGLPVTLGQFDPLVYGYNAASPVAAIMTKLGQLAPSVAVSWIAIAAFSSCNDNLTLLWNPVHQQFWLGQPTGPNATGWAALHLGVRGGSIGDAVLGYYFDNPSFPDQLQRGIYYELLPSDFGGVGTPSSLDTAMGLLEDNNGRLQPGSAPVRNQLFFSLTPGSANQLFQDLSAQQPSALLERYPSGTYTLPGFGATPVQGAPNHYTGATIFVATFNNAGECVDVQVCADWASLHVDHWEAVDALAVALAQAVVGVEPPELQLLQPGTLQYVFSLAGTPAEELLVAADVNISGSSYEPRWGPFRGNNGDRLIGGTSGSLQGVQVVALCSEDPPDSGVPGFCAIGVPERENDTWAGGPYLSLSLAVRTTAAPTSTNDYLELTGVVSGWAGAQQDSVVCLWMEVDAPGHPMHGFRTYYTDPVIRPATAGYHRLPSLGFPPLAFSTPWFGAMFHGALQGNMNCFRFWVQQFQLNQPPTESFRTLVLRQQ